MSDDKSSKENVVKFGVTDGEILLRKLQALRKEIEENWEERSARLSDADRASLQGEINKVTGLLEKLAGARVPQLRN
jgi:hypothetical protein